MFNALRGNGGEKFFPRVTQASSFPSCYCQGLGEGDRGRQRALQGLFTPSPASTHLLLLRRQVPALEIKERTSTAPHTCASSHNTTLFSKARYGNTACSSSQVHMCFVLANLSHLEPTQCQSFAGGQSLLGETNQSTIFYSPAWWGQACNDSCVCSTRQRQNENTPLLSRKHQTSFCLG